MPLVSSRGLATNTMDNSNLAFEQRRRQAISLLAWHLAFGICVLAVLVLALMPTDVPIPGTGWDKSNHLLASQQTLACPGPDPGTRHP